MISDISLALQNKNEIDDIISKMSLSQKIGQLFCIGFVGTKITEPLSDFIKNYDPGSYVLFGRNIENLQQVVLLNKSLLNFSSFGLPPLIAVDEEGGAVARITTSPPLPNALSVGQTKSLRLAHELGIETGRILRNLGFNMNLAPVLDVANPQRFSFIGVRSLGDNPVEVSKLGRSLAEGLLKNKVLPTAKHFPGTGSTIYDPHLVVISKASGPDQLYADAHSFSEFIKISLPKAIMISHLKYPSLDEKGLPGTYSHQIITQLLRKQLGYDGLVITDDLQMNSGKLFETKEQAALEALKAGADIIMITWSLNDQKRAFDHVKKAILSGELSELELNEKLHRILLAKTFLKTDPKPERPHEPASAFQNSTAVVSPVIASLNSEIMKLHLASQMQDDVSPSLFKKVNFTQKDFICVFSPRRDFNKDFATQMKTKKIKFFTLKPDDNRLERTILQKNCGLSIVAVLGYKTAKMTGALSDAVKKKIFIVNMSGPFVLKAPEKYAQVLNFYFPHQGAGGFIAKNLVSLMTTQN